MTNWCLYHALCLDGFASALAVKRRFGNTFQYRAVNYGYPPPSLGLGDNVLIVDFSYPQEHIENLRDVTQTVVILDHHKTAQEDLSHYPKVEGRTWQQCLDDRGDIFVHFDMEKSGAVLTWEFCHPDSLKPLLYKYLQDYDLWRHEYPKTHLLMNSLRLEGWDFDAWDKIVTDFDEDTLGAFSFHTNRGVAIERYQDQEIEGTIKYRLRHFEICGFKDVPLVNAHPLIASKLGNVLAQDAPFAVIYWDSANSRHFTLRSRKKEEGGEDVSAICKQFGGGGHYSAAGFKVFRDHPLAKI